MIFNKEKRIEYLGFNDFWFVIIGAIVLSFVVDFLFKNSFFNYSFIEATVNWFVALLFSLLNWSILRFNMILLRKKFPSFKDNLKRIILNIIVLILTVLLVDIMGNFILSSIFGQNFNPIDRSVLLLPLIIISMMVVATYEAIYFYVRLKKYIREEEQGKQAIVQAQLDVLSNQVQPHFLFNSLNTLRDIIDQDSKEEAKAFVNQLANVYRFFLDSSDSKLITLADELKFAKSYIHIQSERFGQNLKLDWNIPSTYLERLIVPMSLQLLLENAIKHNVISNSKPLLIEVKIMDDYLVVENKIQTKSSQLPSTKVGLANIKKRYTLIAEKMPIIENDGHLFSVSLPLLLATDQKNNYENTDR